MANQDTDTMETVYHYGTHYVARKLSSDDSLAEVSFVSGSCVVESARVRGESASYLLACLRNGCFGDACEFTAPLFP